MKFMRTDTKTPVQVFKIFIWIVFIAEIVLNIALSPLSSKKIGINVFSMLELIFYVYALLCAHGVFKIVSEYVDDDTKVIRYETSVPMIQIILVRIAQVLIYLMFKRADIVLKHFVILVITDILFIIVLLLDKSSYYYESVEENFDD